MINASISYSETKLKSGLKAKKVMCHHLHMQIDVSIHCNFETVSFKIN